jgi:thioredoxin reductase (NADPH)
LDERRCDERFKIRKRTLQRECLLLIASNVADRDELLAPVPGDQLEERGITDRADRCARGRAVRLAEGRIVAPKADGPLTFDSIYPALGSVIRSELAVALGADATDQGCLVVDDHQRSIIPGLYAAGDVSNGWTRSATGGAATTIRNDLAKESR